MKFLSLVFFHDPGHGWLRVPLHALDELNVQGDISPYSYMDSGFAYLEEDCDCGVFTTAAKAAGYELSIADEYQENTPIRTMACYSSAATV